MDGKYNVAVVGGACAGSEMASQLVDAGMEVVVFEQNPLPYGKIEDGLPRWHKKMQDKECAKIDGKMSRDGVQFVPQCRLGYDLKPQDLIDEWGFQMVVLANGAWRDRPLGIPGSEKITDQSIAYQNPFVYWFNHYEDANYNGPHFTVPPGAAVIGGGLASLDVVKIFQFELVKNALKERGLDCDVVEMEHHGIHATLKEHDLTWEGLGIKPARLFYRKRVGDMPLVPLGDDPTPEKLERAVKTREKLINNGITKYGFEVFQLHSPAEVHVDNGSLVSVSFDLMEPTDKGFRKTGGQARIEIPFLISSVGSLPEALPGIPMQGDLYDWHNEFTGEVTGMQQFYCVGNAITGRGNIKESLQNARRLGVVVNAGVAGEEPDYAALFRAAEEEARAHVQRLIGFLKAMPEATEASRALVRAKVTAQHQTLGYSSYTEWRDSVLAQRE